MLQFSNPVGWMDDPNGFSDYKGEQVMTSLIYTPVDASGISFASNGKTYLDVTKYDIEVTK